MKKLGYYWRSFLSYSKFYATVPELRIFWLFFFVVIAALIIDYIFLPQIWFLIVAGIFLVMSVTLFVFGLRLARSNIEIKVERNQLTSVVSALKDGLIAYDPNFKILMFNKAAEQIFDISAKEVVSQSLDPSFIQKPKYKLLAQVMFPSLAPVTVARQSQDADSQTLDLSFTDKNLEVRVLTSRIVDPSGLVLGFFKVVRDRTREVELLKSKSEFITVAAHQLRTPLTGINWTLETLAKSTIIPPDQQAIIKDGLAASQRLLKVVNDLLDVSKLEEGKFGYEFSDVNLIDFIGDILASVAALAREYNIKVYFDRPPQAITARIDQNKMKLALANLIDNAIKYNVQGGEVIVKIEKLTDKPFIQISVKDTGVGIPQEDLDKLFKKFYRGSNVMKMETTGSGLGLYIVRNIIKRHGGEIWAESQIDRGTTFNFTLPTDPKLIPSKEVIYEE